MNLKDLKITDFQEVGITIIHKPTKNKVSLEKYDSREKNKEAALQVMDKMIKGTDNDYFYNFDIFYKKIGVQN
jgi:hypothetical protein